MSKSNHFNLIFILEGNLSERYKIFNKNSSLKSTLLFSRFYLASTNWASNLASLNCANLPSHHLIRGVNNTLGVNTDTLPDIVENYGYKTIFHGEEQHQSIAKKLKFKEIITWKEQPDLRFLVNTMKEHKNSPILYECIINKLNVENENILQEILIKSPNIYPSFLIFMKIEPTSSSSILSNEQKKSNDFYKHNQIELNLKIFSSINLKKITKNNSHIGSIIDIAPNLLHNMGFKIPYTYNGKRENVFSSPKVKKNSPGFRERILCEYLDGSKTLITKNYQMNSKLGKNEAEIYDIQEDPQCINNLWGEKQFKERQTRLTLEFLWAQSDKQVMPMPRIANA